MYRFIERSSSNAYQSPYREISRCNTSVQGLNVDTDLTRIHDDVLALDAEIGELCERMSGLQHHLDELIRKRDNALTESHIIKSLFAPIRRLPPEILSKIFVHCWEPYIPLHSISTPLVLVQVCCFWRLVALSTPLLWSSVSLLRTRSPHNLYRLRDNLVNFLERSIPTPISFRAEFTSFNDIILFGEFLKHANRWQDITIYFPEDDLSHYLGFLLLVGTALPSLKSVHLHSAGPENLTLSHDILCFSVAPHLRDVTLGGILRPSLIQFPWPQLTHLNLGETKPIYRAGFLLRDVVEILRQCLELTHCRLYFDIPGDPVNTITNPVVLPRLRLLHLLDGAGHVWFLEKLVVPNLQELSLGYLDSRPLSGGFRSFLDRSQFALTTLLVEYVDIIETIMIPLEWIPSLEEFRVVFSDDVGASNRSTRLFKALSEWSQEVDAPLILPNLQRLSLDKIVYYVYGDGIITAMWDAFVTMVHTRCTSARRPSLPHSCPSCPGLRYVHLGFDEIHEDDIRDAGIMSRISGPISEGLEFEIGITPFDLWE